ncbi:MAG: DUF3343 domain-containing protein [Chloroflexota bacterium]
MAFKKKGIAFKGDGIVIFQGVSHAIEAEKLIKGADYEIKLIAPPPELRMGCDLALEINLVESAGIERLLKEKDAAFVGIFPLMKGTADMCEIVKITDYGQWTMVKAGNMKISFDKGSGIIVNISGGGCPDIPYLNVELVDKLLTEAPKPKDLGFTLCAVMLDLALEECLNLWNGGNN